MGETKVVMVTGGNGLVGRAMLDYAKEHLREERWVSVDVEDGDLRKMEDSRRIFEEVKPTHVIHLAARVGGLFTNMKYKVEFYRENMLINDNVMECCRIYGVKKLVSFLSTCIFPDKTSYPINETMVHNGPPHFSNEGYAYAKRMIDVMNRCYKDEYGCNFTSVVPTNIFGPYDNYRFESSHVIPALIHKCYLSKRDNKPFVVLGSGSPLRQFVFSRDLAKLLSWVLEKYDDPNPLILSVDEDQEISIRDVALMIVDAMEFTGEVVFDTSAADGQFKKTADNSKMRKLLAETYPEFSFTSMRDALKESCDWFSANYNAETTRK